MRQGAAATRLIASSLTTFGRYALGWRAHRIGGYPIISRPPTHVPQTPSPRRVRSLLAFLWAAIVGTLPPRATSARVDSRVGKRSPGSLVAVSRQSAFATVVRRSRQQVGLPYDKGRGRRHAQHVVQRGGLVRIEGKVLHE
jgi:hypothetical protein